MKSVNVSGKAYGFLCMTPIKPGAESELRTYLEGLGHPGPLAKVPRTHMARWVIVEKFCCKPSYKQRKPETLAIPSLVFSSNFDGVLDSYLDELCESMAPEAAAIWGHCIGCPAKPRGAALKAYLKHNQIHCGFFYAAYGTATVSEVNASLNQRDRLIAFATRGQGMAPSDLQHAFVKEFVS